MAPLSPLLPAPWPPFAAPRPLPPFLATLWPRLGAFGPSFAAVGLSLAALGSRLAASSRSWQCLGPVLGPFGFHVGASLAACWWKVRFVSDICLPTAKKEALWFYCRTHLAVVLFFRW